MIVHGDNLEALKALFPYYRERVELVFIDPPYNTGNENWVYNDRMNAPKIKEWLGKVVGGEGEDHYAIVLMDEIFGRTNFIASVIWQKVF